MKACERMCRTYGAPDGFGERSQPFRAGLRVCRAYGAGNASDLRKFAGWHNGDAKSGRDPSTAVGMTGVWGAARGEKSRQGCRRYEGRTGNGAGRDAGGTKDERQRRWLEASGTLG